MGSDMKPRIVSYHHGATIYGQVTPNRLDNAQPQDRIHIAHDEKAGDVLFDMGRVNSYGHTIWHNGERVPPYQYRKVTLDKGKISIKTFSREVTVVEDGESSPGMRSGTVSTVEPL